VLLFFSRWRLLRDRRRDEARPELYKFPRRTLAPIFFPLCSIALYTETLAHPDCHLSPPIGEAPSLAVTTVVTAMLDIITV
jgi:hypothetical protein